VVLGALLFVWAPGARADISFCPSGSGAGQCEGSAGVATDFETGRVYVADVGNSRINVFESDGKFVMAFGWGVNTGAGELQTCGPAMPELEPDTGLCQNGIAGSSAGQFKGPRAIAVDNDPASSVQHDIYVVTQDFRVQRFSPEGKFRLGFGWGVRSGAVEAQTCGPEAAPPIAECQAGIKGKGKCQLGRAIDDSVAVGPGGAIRVADTAGTEPNFTGRIEKFEPSGVCAGEAVLFESQDHILINIAADLIGNVYVYAERDEKVIRGYPSESNVPFCEIDEGVETTALAVDPSDHLFAAQRESKAKPPGSFGMVTEYDLSCNSMRRFAYVPKGARGVAAFHSAEGDVFASLGGEEIHYIPIPPPGPIVAEPSVEAPTVSNTKATLYAEVNPEGEASTFHFDYVDEATYLKDIEELGPGHGFDHATSTAEAPLAANPKDPDPDEFKLHAAEALAGCLDPVKEAGEEGKCLTPETEYRFQIVAKNTDGEGNSSVEGVPFTTGPPIGFDDAWSTAVGVDTAKIHTEVNPFGIPAAGWFEYVDDATYQEDVEELGPGHGFDHATQSPNVGEGATPIDLGAGEELSTHSATLFPLSPGTTYHYRLVAQDPLIEPLGGPERIFRTFAKQTPDICPANEAFRSGPAALLPDCRAYELVSPLKKNNGDIVVLDQFSTNLPAVLDQSSDSGAKLAYGTYRAFGDAQAGPWTSQYIASRDLEKEEWASRAISPPRLRPIFRGALPAIDTEFKAFSPDLCESWLRTIFDPPLALGGIEGFPNIYRHKDAGCGEPGYEALSNAPWPNLAQGNENEGAKTELQGVSADGEKAIFVAFDSLEGSGAPLQPAQCVEKGAGCNQELYISAGGPAPVFVCVLPSGEGLAESCSGGSNAGAAFPGRMRSSNVQGALSEDGTRAFWTDSGNGLGKIYVREHPEQGQVAEECTLGKACTIAVSKEAEEESVTEKSRFLAAAVDGSKALFVTVDASENIADLYLFDVDGEATRLIATNGPPNTGSGILGTSEDLSHIYFASTDAMGGENSEGEVAVAGKANLYLDKEGAIRFIGTFSSADVENGAFNLSAIEREPRGHVARVSPDGAHAVFMSSAPLTGYDSTDAKSPETCGKVKGICDAELFLYDAAANGGAGELICASCNPSGGRPVGENLRGSAAPFWAAAHIPVFENTLYASRVLSDDGRRLYFESSDALVARDTNGKPDVYQWEAVSKGGCDKADATFSAQNEGCIDLISSGLSARGSEIVDMSPSGNDVFFASLSSLLPQDYGLVDIYDARVSGGFKPPQSPKKHCEGGACQSPPPAPIPPTPATAAGGFGQVPPPEAKGCPKGKKQVKRKGKLRCVPKKAKGGKRR
jgi:hypothetical protein